MHAKRGALSVTSCLKCERCVLWPAQNIEQCQPYCVKWNSKNDRTFFPLVSSTILRLVQRARALTGPPWLGAARTSPGRSLLRCRTVTYTKLSCSTRGTKSFTLLTYFFPSWVPRHFSGLWELPPEKHHPPRLIADGCHFTSWPSLKLGVIGGV